MAKKKTEKKYPETNLIPFKREDYVRQPRSVSNMQYRMDIIQLRTFACLMEKMEPLVIELLGIYNAGKGQKKLSLFDLPQAKQHIDSDGAFTFTIPLKSLGISPGFYQRAKASLEDMTTFSVGIPYINEKGEERNKTTSVFSIDTKKDERYVKDFKIGMVRSVLDTMVDIRLGYNDYLKRIAFVTSNVNTVRLYVLATTNTIRNKKSNFEISLEDFRNFLGLYNEVKGKRTPKYKRFADLDKRVLTPATEELKRLADNGNSDFWIKIDRVGIGEAGNPRFFHISVFYTDLAEDEQLKKQRRKEDAELDNFLKTALRQTSFNIRKIRTRLLPEQRAGFIQEVQRIASLLETRNDIENPCSFAWVLLNNWLDDHEPKVEEIKEPTQLEIFPISDASLQSEKPIPTNEDTEQWNRFLSVVQGRVGKNTFDTWFSCLGFVSYSGNILTASVPTQFVFDYLENNYLEVISSSLKEVYDIETELNYTIQKK